MGAYALQPDSGRVRQHEAASNPLRWMIESSHSAGQPSLLLPHSQAETRFLDILRYRANTGCISNTTMADAIALTTKLTMAATATSTVASGERARGMLDEMLAGHALLFRSVTAAAAYGLPNGGMFNVGQLTKDGPRPFPLDDSFRTGLKDCGVTPRADDAAKP